MLAWLRAQRVARAAGSRAVMLDGDVMVYVLVVLGAVMILPLLHGLLGDRLVHRRRGIRPSDPVVPTFRVVALGLAGSGKTVLLASQSQQLSARAGERRYWFEGDFDQDTRLAQMQALRTDEAWPPGTARGDDREFLFDCNVSDGAGDPRTVLRVNYLDYAGELLELRDDEQAAPEQIKNRVENAHGLLVMLDGERVREFLDDERRGLHYFEVRLWPLLNLARRAPCPVQLVVTKWDLVRSSDDASHDDRLLRDLGERLLRLPTVRQLVQERAQRRNRVRLIPVSAVGPHFAELRDGKVVKRADGKLEPINVEVPLCTVLPDMLKYVRRSLDPELRAMLDAEVRRRLPGDLPTVSSSVLASKVGALVRNALGVVMGDLLVGLLVEMLVRATGGAKPPSENPEAETQWLRAEVVEHMEEVVMLFRGRLPHSSLNVDG